MAVKDYKTNPDENTTISGINIAEGCPPSGINNAIRQLMADVKADSDEQDTAISKAQTTAQTAADGKVSKSGDTMTGALIVPLVEVIQNNGVGYRLIDNRLVAETVPSKELNNQIWFTDKNRQGVGVIQNVLYPDGHCSMFLMTRNKIDDNWSTIYVHQWADRNSLMGTSANVFQFGNGAQIWVE